MENGSNMNFPIQAVGVYMKNVKANKEAQHLCKNQHLREYIFKALFLLFCLCACVHLGE